MSNQKPTYQELEKRISQLEQELEIEREHMQNTAIECDKKSQIIFERITDSFIAFDTNWCYTHINKSAAAILNRQPEDLIGKNVWEEFPESVGQPFHKAYLEAMSTQKYIYLEEYNRPYDLWFENRIYPSKEGLSIFFHDITNRKQAELALEESETYNRLLIEQLPIGLVVNTMDGAFINVNPAFCKIIGRTVKETLNLSYWDITPRVYQNQEQEQLEVLAATGRYGPYEKEYIHKNGHLVPVRLQGLIIERERKKYIWSSVEDISERKRTENLLHQSEERLSKIFHSSPCAIVVSRISDGKFIDLNEAACEIYGFKREEIIGHSSLELGVINYEERMSLMTTLQAEGYLRNQEVIIHSRNQGDRTVLYSIDMLIIDDEQCMLSSLVDITERIQIERALRTSRERLDFALNQSHTGGWDLDLIDHTAYRTLKHDHIFGYQTLLPEWTYEMFLEHIIPEDRNEVDQQFKVAVQNKSDWNFTCRILRNDGEIRWIWATGGHQPDESGNIRRMTGIVQDITERKKAEEEISLKNMELQTLNRIIVKTNEVLSLQSRLENIMDEALRIVGLEGGTICLINPDDTFELAVQREASDETIKDLSTSRIKIGDCLCGNCAFDCRPLILNTREEVLNYATREVLRGEDIRFHAAMPFLIGGNCVGVLCVFTRTDKKPTENSLKLLEIVCAQVSLLIKNAQLYDELNENEELMRLSTELANVAAWEFDFTTNSMTRSKNHDCLYGLEVQYKWAFDTFLNATHPDDREMSNTFIQNSVATGGLDKYQFDFRVIYPDQSIHWLNVIGEVIKRNEKGEGVLVRGFIIDITDRKRAEEAVRKSEERYRTIIANIPGGLIHIIDRDMRYVFNAGEELERLGLSDEFLVGKSIHEVLSADVASIVESQYKRVLAGETVRFDGRYGEDYFSLTSAPLRNTDGEIENILTLSVNITERKRTEQNLAESEKRYRSLFENMNSGFVLFEVVQSEQGIPVDLVIKAANTGFEKTTGLNLKDAIGSHLTKVLPGIEKDEADWIGTYSKVALTGEAIQIEQGSELLGYYYSISAYQASPKHCAVTFTDITERKQAEEKLRDSESRFRRAIIGAPFPIIIHAEDGHVININEPWTRLTGYEHSDIPTIADWTRKAYGIQMDLVLADIDNLFVLDGPKSEGEYTITTSSGASRIWDFSSAPIGKLPDGRRLVISMAMDVTERKKAELDLLRMTRIMKNSQEIAHLGSFEFVATDQTTIWSEEEYRIYGLDPNGPSPEYNVMLEKCIHPGDAKLLHDTFMAAMQNQGVYELEHRIVRPDGSVRWVYDKAHPYVDEHGKLLRYVGATIDITERKHFLEELEKLNTELELKVEQRTALLEASNKELEAFSYSVSHDLRAPLRHINGYVELLNERFRNELPEKARHYLDTVSGASSQMGTLIDDLLQYSRTGQKEVKKTELDLNMIVKEVLEELETVRKGRKINWDIKKLPKVIGDYTLLKLVWANLLDNAIKYTRNQQTAQISIGYKEEAKYFVFCVCDNGVGFDMKYANKLFGVFQRLHSQTEFEGTGIGLANVQRIVHKHIGRVWAEAEPGKGAKFYFSLPINKEEIS